MKIEKLLEKYKGVIIPTAILLIALAIVKEPIFFDNFGIVIFAFLFLSSGYIILNKKYPQWIIYTYLAIGVAGLIVDSIQILK